MVTKRLILGPRQNGDVGLFVSPPGVNADTAADSALVLSANIKVSQLILLGSIAAPGGIVTLGLSSKPFVMLTSEWDFSGVVGHTYGSGPVRPSPVSYLYSTATATINSGGASMTISSAYKCTYHVYSAAF